MGLENLKSVFAPGNGGVGFSDDLGLDDFDPNNFNPTSNPGGRHGINSHPQNHSLLDSFVGIPSTPTKSTPIYNSLTNTNLVNFTTTTNSENPFPTNYTAQNTINGDGQFTNLGGSYGSEKYGWFSLYNSNHTSLNIDQPSPRSNNPFQPFRHGNPNVNIDLNIRDSNVRSSLFSPSRNSLIGNTGEPYIISKIATSDGGFSGGRLTNAGNRILPAARALTDVARVGKYLASPAGLLELAIKNSHLLVPSSVVRDKDKLIKVPQRFNAGFNPLSTLGSVGGRLLGQGVPNFMIKSGFSSGYGERAGVFDLISIKGDFPKTENKLNFTFTGATLDVNGDKISNVDDTSSGFANLGGKGTVAKTSTGDKMTLAPMIRGTSLAPNGADDTWVKSEYKGKFSDDDGTLGVAIGSSKDGMPLYFKDLRDNSYIVFRAYVDGITEDISPSWAEHNYIGRSEPVYVYERATRSISFSLKLMAQTRNELTAIYKKMNRLTSLCYPEYAKDVRLGNKTRMKPPLTKFRLGELFGKTNDELLGFIETLSYVVPDETTYETEVGARVPKYVQVTIGYKVIHGEVPGLYKGNVDSSDATPADAYGYYGYKGDK